MEEVQCAECAARYDSQVQPFCPRCGNEGSRPLQAPVGPGRFEPRRRRAQLGGLILAVLGFVSMVQLAWVAAFADPLSDAQLDDLAQVPLLQSQQGGDLHLRVVHGGEPVSANVTFQDMEGELLVSMQTQGGWANATGLGTAFGRVRIEGETNTTLSFYAPAGTRHAQAIDLDDPPQWVGERPVTATRVMSGMLAAFAGFVMVAGVLAFRLRAWRLGVAGAVLAVVPALVMLLAAPVAGILLLVPAAVALWCIITGRRHFA